MHRYMQAQSAHTYQESSETEFESDYHADFDQSMIIYCLALTVRGVWRGVCYDGQFLWRVI
ncbi:MAG: hypothetical protein J07HQX50_01760 [Haloquadratum sp. J07HQX50]|jgi:hypothetical protein|nr:MAG: hypothetical protein J07HQX50_01760 [Haloquadratum sp. J07HQX50]